MPSEATRAWIYRILLALGAIAAAYGFLTNEQLVAWLGVAAAVLNILPVANTTTKLDTKDDESANL